MFHMISIHALVKRATDDCVKRLILAKNFNPRPREEGDPFLYVISSKFNRISIHALVKRATEYVLRLKHSLIISIHALVKRATMAENGIIA